MAKVASTPYVKPRVQNYLADLDPEFSPIIYHEPATETLKDSQSQPLAITKENGNVRGKRHMRKSVLQTILPVKKNNVSADKGSGVEQSVTQGRHNMLSHSLNKYNLYPEPIILDSDDEDTYQVLKIGRKNITKKNKLSENAGTTEETKTKLHKRKTVIRSDENKKPAKMKLRKAKCRPLAATQTQRVSSESSPRAEGELLLENVTNTSLDNKTIKRIKRPKKNYGLAPNETPHINNEEDLFSSILPVIKVPVSVENMISDNEDIKWTPRRAKIHGSVKHADEESDTDKEAGKSKSIPNVQEGEKEVNVSSNKTTGKLANFSKATTLMDSDSEDNLEEGKFPEGCLSLFKELVFRRNKGSQGVVANCLETSHNKFGYIEVEEGKDFTGNRANTTFIVLEGSVKASQLGAKQILCPGDALHISLGSEYKFIPFGPGHARLLFIKEK